MSPGERKGPAVETGPLDDAFAGANPSVNVVPLRYGLTAIIVRDPHTIRRRSKRTAEQSDPVYQAWLAQQRPAGSGS
jgi:hypothetical protein